jgi:hypothetical protein
VQRGLGRAARLDVIRGEEITRAVAAAVGRFLYLGPDTLERLQVKLDRIERDVAPWREKSAATAHDGAA